MSDVFDTAALGVLIIRVSDVAASVQWYRDTLGVQPLHVGDDGPEHPTATFRFGGLIASLWQLPPGVTRDREENDRNSYPVFVVDDPAAARSDLAARGVAVSELRASANHRFFWFHDPDGNRFEMACPSSDAGKADFGRVRDLL